MSKVKKSKIGKISLLEEPTPTPDMGAGNIQEDSDTDAVINNLENPLLHDEKEEKEEKEAKGSNIRWLALFLCCFSFIGAFFNGNLIQALQTYIMKDFGISLTEYNSINSISSVPSMFLPFISGVLVDRFGIRKCYFIASFISLAGYAIIAYGVYETHFTLLVVGSVISSVGDGPVNICKNAMLVKWFVGKELSLALGTALCICRLGSSISSFFSPMVYNEFKILWVPFLVGVGVSTISFLSTCGLVYIDLRTDRQADQTEDGETKQKGKPVGLRDLKKFKLIYLILLLDITFTYTAVFGFTSNANDLIAKRFGFTPAEAGRLLTIIYICPLIITPTIGYFTDKFGKRILIIMIGSLCFLGTQFAIAMLEDVEPDSGNKNYLIAVCLLSIGIFYASYAGIVWPCVALVVNEKLTGLAYGLVSTFQNLLGVIYPLGLGYIHDNTTRSHGYFWTQITLTGVAGLASLLAISLYVIDKKTGGRLNRPGTKRKLSVREKVYSTVSNAN